MSAFAPESSYELEASVREGDAADERRSSAPPGRWWFAFDRWLPVIEPEADEFVLA